MNALKLISSYNNQNKPNNNTNRYGGFTIIELLIVIVIIGILVAITTIAYTGLQDRARAAATESDLSNIKKAFTIYAIDSNKFPENAEEMEQAGLGGLMQKTRFTESGEWTPNLNQPLNRGDYLINMNNFTHGNGMLGASLFMWYWDYAETKSWQAYEIHINSDGSMSEYRSNGQLVNPGGSGKCQTPTINECEYVPL